MATKDAVPLMVRIEPDLHRQLVKEAAHAVRSLNAEIRFRLRQSLEQQQEAAAQ